MSEINPSHLHWNGPAEVRFKINPLNAAAEAGPGERYRTRMELEPRVALHQLGFLQRAQQEEENGMLSTEQELRAPVSKQICPASHHGMALKQPRGFQDVSDHAEPCLTPGDDQRAAPGGFPAGSSHRGCSGQAALPLSRQYRGKG